MLPLRTRLEVKVQKYKRQIDIFSTPLHAIFKKKNSATCPQKKNTVILHSSYACILTFGLKSVKWLFEFNGNNLYWWFRGNMVIFLKKVKIGTCKIYLGYSSKTRGSFFLLCVFHSSWQNMGSFSLILSFWVHFDLWNRRYDFSVFSSKDITLTPMDAKEQVKKNTYILE